MKRTIAFEIDSSIASKADTIYKSLGMDISMALNLFMRRTVLEGKLPFELISQSCSLNSEKQDSNRGKLKRDSPQLQRENTTITQTMVQAVWDEFAISLKSKESNPAFSFNHAHGFGEVSPSHTFKLLHEGFFNTRGYQLV